MEKIIVKFDATKRGFVYLTIATAVIGIHVICEYALTERKKHIEYLKNVNNEILERNVCRLAKLIEEYKDITNTAVEISEILDTATSNGNGEKIYS